MTALAQTNGHHAAEPDPLEAFESQVAEQIDGMRSLLAEQRSMTRHVQAQLDEQKARERRIEKALAALQGNTSATAATRPRSAPSERKRYVSEESVETVYRALEAAGSEQRQADLQQATGLSSPTISQALTALREAERVRITRVEGQSKFYALMPGAAADGA